MKYAQLLVGLLAGTALGSTVIAGNIGGFGGGMNEEAIKKIVRETISAEPKLIMDSVQKFQESQREEKVKSAGEALKDPALKAAVFDAKTAAPAGAAEGDKIVVEFFDYNCPACKMQFKMLSDAMKKDPSIRVLFREYPIFGPVSETNSKIGLAVSHIAPDKYLAFHEKMMTSEGRLGEKEAFGFVKAIGLDVEKVKAEMANPAVEEALKANRDLGEKLHIQGTPTLVIGDELVPHALSTEEIEQKLSGKAE
jgi:protein-disulfide isomerase